MSGTKAFMTFDSTIKCIIGLLKMKPNLLDHKYTYCNLNDQFWWLQKVVWIKCSLLWGPLTSPEWFWLITAGHFAGPIVIGLVWYTHKPQTQTLQRKSLRTSALIWKSPILIWTSQGSHLEPFKSSYRSNNHLYTQLFVSIKCMVQLCQWSNQKTQTVSCCWENTGQDGQESTTEHQKASLQWIRSCWKTGVGVHSRVCFTSTWAERLLWKKEALASDGALSSSTEVCCWPHGQRKKLSRGKLCGQMNKKLSCLTTLSSNMFGGEKVRPLTARTSYLLSSMVLVVQYHAAGLFWRHWIRWSKEGKWNNVKAGLYSNSSGKPEIISRRLDLGFSWVFQQNSKPKHTSEVVKESINYTRIKVSVWHLLVLNWTPSLLWTITPQDPPYLSSMLDSNC